MIRDDELRELKYLAENATEGPWYRCSTQICRKYPPECSKHAADSSCNEHTVDLTEDNNLKFVIAAIGYVPELVAEVNYYRKQLADSNDFLIEQDEKIKRLEKEADWLADMGDVGGCPITRKKPFECIKDSDGNVLCNKCWRIAAKEAVANVEY